MTQKQINIKVQIPVERIDFETYNGRQAHNWISPVNMENRNGYPNLSAISISGMLSDTSPLGYMRIEGYGVRGVVLWGGFAFNDVSYLDKLCARWLVQRGIIQTYTDHLRKLVREDDDNQASL